ncbi:MAG: hypothetical protein IKM34_01650 [Clostridia bacterium]|nr:hypothetical protein [Clostridia bacterium]
MKKALFLLTLAATVLALCLTLSACGDKTPATTAAAVTTAPATTPVVTTSVTTSAMTTPAVTSLVVTTPVTTPTVTTPDTTPDFVPEMPAKVGISYSYFFSGFMYTTMDENGLTVKRELYKPSTMQIPDDYLAFCYEYDANGKLTSYTSDIYGKKTVGTVTWESDGLTATVTDPASGEAFARILFNDDGTLDDEIWLENGKEIFVFDYETDGRLNRETIPGDMELAVVTAYEGNEATVLYEVMYTKVGHFVVTYNDAGYPVALQNMIEGDEAYYSYEYDKYNRCVEVDAVVDGYEDIYFYTYDNQGRLGKVELEDDFGLRETVYTYNDKNQKIRLAVTQKNHSGEVEDFYVTTHEYDENGRRTKTVDYESGDEATHITKWIYCFAYNENGLLAEETADYRQADGGFIASFKDTYEYDEFDREIKYTLIEYKENGSMLNKTVTETEYAENGSVAKETVSRYNAEDVLVDQEVTDYTK